MTPITLAPGEAEEVVFVLGQADTNDQVRHVIAIYTAPGQVKLRYRRFRACGVGFGEPS